MDKRGGGVDGGGGTCDNLTKSRDIVIRTGDGIIWADWEYFIFDFGVIWCNWLFFKEEIDDDANDVDVDVDIDSGVSGVW